MRVTSCGYSVIVYVILTLRGVGEKACLARHGNLHNIHEAGRPKGTTGRCALQPPHYRAPVAVTFTPSGMHCSNKIGKACGKSAAVEVQEPKTTESSDKIMQSASCSDWFGQNKIWFCTCV